MSAIRDDFAVSQGTPSFVAYLHVRIEDAGLDRAQHLRHQPERFADGTKRLVDGTAILSPRAIAGASGQSRHAHAHHVNAVHSAPREGRSHMALRVRRVITGHDANGKAIVAIDEVATHLFEGRPGATGCKVWTTEGFPANNDGHDDAGLRKVGTTLPN